MGRFAGLFVNQGLPTHFDRIAGFCKVVNPDISRVACTHIQGIRVADVVVYLKALITRKMGALGSPEG